MILDRSYFYPSKIMLTSVLLVKKYVLGSTQTQYILHKKNPNHSSCKVFHEYYENSFNFFYHQIGGELWNDAIKDMDG